MKKYMVIDCCEREIGEPKFFDTLIKAQIRLFELFCDACKYVDEKVWELEIHDKDELEDAIESLANADIFDDENDYNYTEAWCETSNHDNWDGKIIEVEI